MIPLDINEDLENIDLVGVNDEGGDWLESNEDPDEKLELKSRIRNIMSPFLKR